MNNRNHPRWLSLNWLIEADLGPILMGRPTRKDVGGGAILHLDDHHHYQSRMGLGPRSNNYVELQCLRLLLIFAWEIHCNSIQIFGEFMLVINWFNEVSHCHTHTLSTLLREVHHLKLLFNSISMAHIYRTRNKVADKLSKEAAKLNWGTWHITERIGEQVFRFYHRPFMDEAPDLRVVWSNNLLWEIILVLVYLPWTIYRLLCIFFHFAIFFPASYAPNLQARYMWLILVSAVCIC